MSPSTAAIMEAEASAAASRFTMRGLLQVEESRAKPDDMAVIANIRAAATAADYDKMLGLAAVVDLFRRQVLYFGDAR